jgi:protein involved in polysaccharide export with SLBB domain
MERRATTGGAENDRRRGAARCFPLAPCDALLCAGVPLVGPPQQEGSTTADPVPLAIRQVVEYWQLPAAARSPRGEHAECKALIPMTNHPSAPHVLRPLPRRSRRRAVATALTLVTALGAAVPVATASAQQPGATGQPAVAPASAAKSAARADLERQLAAAEAAGRSADVATIRRRLTEGDLRPGDRIALDVSGNLTVHDTIAVRAGQVITIPTLPDISVRGVLVPELNDYLTSQIARYVRDPVVHSMALTRVSIAGAVARPGFYAVPADILLGDVVMHAGGPTQNADMHRTVVRRGTKEILSGAAVQRALRDGATISQVGLMAGDEVVVGEKKQRNWSQMILVTTGLITSIVGVLFLINR